MSLQRQECPSNFMKVEEPPMLLCKISRLPEQLDNAATTQPQHREGFKLTGPYQQLLKFSVCCFFLYLRSSAPNCLVRKYSTVSHQLKGKLKTCKPPNMQVTTIDFLCKQTPSYTTAYLQNSEKQNPMTPLK